MKCLFFRPLLESFQALRVRNDIIEFLRNEKSWICDQTNIIYTFWFCHSLQIICPCSTLQHCSLWIIVSGTNAALICKNILNYFKMNSPRMATEEVLNKCEPLEKIMLVLHRFTNTTRFFVVY